MTDRQKLTIYRITLKCRNVPIDQGALVAKELDKEFNAMTWHADAHCWWNGSVLFLTAWNNFDETGQALIREFADAIRARVHTLLEPEIETVEVLMST